MSSSFSSQPLSKKIPQFQIFEENPFEHLDHLLGSSGGRDEGPIIILTASLLSRPCLPVYRPVYSRVSPCITVYCPHRVSRCIGTENLRSHTEPVSSASSTDLAFSWFGIGIQLEALYRTQFISKYSHRWAFSSSPGIIFSAADLKCYGADEKQLPMSFVRD